VFSPANALSACFIHPCMAHVGRAIDTAPLSLESIEIL
jgi:hypothetical protein